MKLLLSLKSQLISRPSYLPKFIKKISSYLKAVYS